MEQVSSLLSGLFELSKDVPLAAGEAFRERLTQLHDQCFLGIDEELLGIAGEGTAKLSVLNVTNINGETKDSKENNSNGRTLSRPGSARIQKGRR